MPNGYKTILWCNNLFTALAERLETSAQSFNGILIAYVDGSLKILLQLDLD